MSKFILVGLSLSVVYNIFYYAQNNGLIDLSRKSEKAGLLPDTKYALRTEYTGIAAIDHLLTVLTIFFWPVADGAHPALLLHTIGFSGAFMAAWVLVVLESWRQGNSRLLAISSTLFGLAAQGLTYAFAAPLFGALQLATSITASRPDANNTRISASVLRLIPLAFALGNQIPSFAMLLPLSDTITSDRKQILIALWQPWPAYVALLVLLAKPIADMVVQEDGPNRRSALRYAYAFAFANAALSHLVTLIPSVATVAAPFIFNPRFAEELHPSKVYAFPRTWEATKIGSIGDGVHAFLRWDFLIGTTGTLIWALTLHNIAHRQVYGKISPLALLYKISALFVLAGPVGAAVELMWERDELLLSTPAAVRKSLEK